MIYPPKLTIAALMGLVVLCAATFAALRTSSPYGASVMVSLTILVLLGSVVASLWGRHRAGWSGFAMFGWGYFLLTFTAPFRDVVRPHLLTSVAIVESYRHLHPEVRVEVTDLTRLPGAGVPIGPSQLATGGPDQMPAPQFVAVAGGGPLPIIPITYPGVGVSSYVPAGPNRFYTFECSAHAACTLACAGLGACSPPGSPVEPRRDPREAGCEAMPPVDPRSGFPDTASRRLGLHPIGTSGRTLPA
jgi:hypothetical protein